MIAQENKTDRIAGLILGLPLCGLVSVAIVFDLYGSFTEQGRNLCECGWMRSSVEELVLWSLFELTLLGGAAVYGILGRPWWLAVTATVLCPLILMGWGVWYGGK